MLKYSIIDLPYASFQKSMKFSLEESLAGRYGIDQRIGVGNHSVIFLGSDLQHNNRYVAIKVIDLRKYEQDYSDNEAREKAKNLSRTEAENMSRVNSKYIVKFYETMQNKDASLRIIVMEYCEGPTLSKYIFELRENGEQLTQREVLSILTNIIAGIHALHENNLIHRDLHPGNIMKCNENWVIVDLGFSKFIKFKNQIKKHTFLGTLYTMAPQVLCFQPYGTKADVWSIGMLGFFMLTAGYYLIETNIKNYNKDIMMKIIQEHLLIEFSEEEIQWEMLTSISRKYSLLKKFQRSAEIIKFLGQILVFDKNKRISLSKLEKHHIFQTYAFNMSKIVEKNTNVHSQLTSEITSCKSNDITYFDFEIPNKEKDHSKSMQIEEEEPLSKQSPNQKYSHGQVQHRKQQVYIVEALGIKPQSAYMHSQQNMQVQSKGDGEMEKCYSVDN